MSESPLTDAFLATVRELGMNEANALLAHAKTLEADLDKACIQRDAALQRLKDGDDLSARLWRCAESRDQWKAAHREANLRAINIEKVTAERDELREKLKALVDALDNTYWSSWQGTGSFNDQREAARALLEGDKGGK